MSSSGSPTLSVAGYGFAGEVGQIGSKQDQAAIVLAYQVEGGPPCIATTSVKMTSYASPELSFEKGLRRRSLLLLTGYTEPPSHG